MNLEGFSDLVCKAFSSSGERLRLEDAIQELFVRSWAGKLDVEDWSSEKMRTQIRKMARSLRGKSTPLTRQVEDKKALATWEEHDPCMPQEWGQLRSAFSDVELESMLEPARLGETDQPILAEAIGLKSRAFRYRVQKIKNNTPK